MKVYRVENVFGEGPYNCWRTDACWFDHGDMEHPTPKEENIPLGHCAFESMEKLLKWFNAEDIEEFINKGQRVQEYEINERYISIGKRQVTIDSDYFKAIQSQKLAIYKQVAYA